MTPQEAFDYPETAEALGVPLYFSPNHFHFAAAIIKEGRMAFEEQTLAAFWVASLDPGELTKARRQWRRDPDAIFEQVEQVSERYNITPGGAAALEVAEVVAGLWQSVDDSREEPDADGEGDDDGAPGKSAPPPATSPRSPE